MKSLNNYIRPSSSVPVVLERTVAQTRICTIRISTT